MKDKLECPKCYEILYLSEDKEGNHRCHFCGHRWKESEGEHAAKLPMKPGQGSCGEISSTSDPQYRTYGYIFDVEEEHTGSVESLRAVIAEQHQIIEALRAELADTKNYYENAMKLFTEEQQQAIMKHLKR